MRENAVLNPFQTQGMIRDPRRFFGREAELKVIRDLLARRLNASVVAERRLGKSSLLFYASQVIAGKLGVRATYLDLQMIADAGEFFEEVAERVRSEASTPRSIQRALAERPLLLCLDEFDKAAGNPAFPDDFFDALRSLAQTDELTLLVATRVPLIDLAAAHATTSPFFNIFQPTPIHLGPLPEKEAHQLIAGTAALAEVTFKEPWIEQLVALTDRSPWQLQLAGSLAFQVWREKGDFSAVGQRFKAARTGQDGRRGARVTPGEGPSWRFEVAAGLAGLLAFAAALIAFIASLTRSGGGVIVASVLGLLALALTAVLIFIASQRAWRR